MLVYDCRGTIRGLWSGRECARLTAGPFDVCLQSLPVAVFSTHTHIVFCPLHFALSRPCGDLLNVSVYTLAHTVKAQTGSLGWKLDRWGNIRASTPTTNIPPPPVTFPVLAFSCLSWGGCFSSGRVFEGFPTFSQFGFLEANAIFDIYLLSNPAFTMLATRSWKSVLSYVKHTVTKFVWGFFALSFTECHLAFSWLRGLLSSQILRISPMFSCALNSIDYPCKMIRCTF